MAIPYREFDGEPGDYSVDTAGPIYLQKDFDKLFAMFNPKAVHSDGSPGGITMENFAESIIYDCFYQAVRDWLFEHPGFILGKLVFTDEGEGNLTLTFQHDSIDEE